MAIIQNTPQLRFPGFDEYWKETLLNDVAEFRKGKGISKSDIIEDGNLECIRYGELYTTYNELIVNIISKTNLPIKGLELSVFNDVIIPASGETQLDIATASCVLKSGVALSGDLNIIRSSLNGIFLSFYLNSKKKLEIAKLAQGSSVVHLYSSQLKSLKLNIPTLQEQQKIASFLSAIDEKIQQLSRKKELLLQYKKGVTQQLFSGKLRFKDENGEDYADWEEKTFGDIYSFYTTNSLSREKLNYDSGAVKNIHYGDIHTKFKTLFDVNEEVVPFVNSDFDISKIKSECYCQEGDLVIADASEDYADIGKSIEIINLQNEKIVAGLHTFLARPNKTKMYVGFSGYKVRSENFRKQIMLIAQGSKVLSISTGRLAMIKMKIPVIQEQQKIAAFLSSIYTKIESTSQQINQMQSFKKGLLQQLFV